MEGGTNYIGHTFVIRSQFAEDELEANLIEYMNEEKISYISVSVCETLLREDVVSLEKAKERIKKGLD